METNISFDRTLVAVQVDVGWSNLAPRRWSVGLSLDLVGERPMMTRPGSRTSTKESTDS